MNKKPYHLPTTILVFFLLYMFQGILYGYVQSLKYILKSKGTDYAHLSIFDLVNSPSYFKFFAAPVLDIYYSRALGKRMTYITALSVISALLFIVLGLKSELWIDTQSIWTLTATSFTLMVAICVQDVAIDSLVEEVFTEEHTKFGPLMQTIGQIIGPLVSFNIFVYFYTAHPGLSFYLPLIFATFILASTVWVRFNVSENELEQQFETPLDLIKTLPNFWHNPNLRLYIFHILTYEFGINFWRQISPMILMDNGFTLADMSKLGTTETLWAVLSILLLFKMSLNSRPWWYIRTAYIATLVGVALDFLIVSRLTHTKDVSQTYHTLLLTQPFVIAIYVEFSAKVTYNNLICDYALSGTFLSVLNSLCNFSRIFFQPLFTFALSLASFKVLTPIAIAYSVFYYTMVMPKTVGALEKLKREDFAISTPARIDKKKEN